jgi:hypothetical protein
MAAFVVHRQIDLHITKTRCIRPMKALDSLHQNMAWS